MYFIVHQVMCRPRHCREFEGKRIPHHTQNENQYVPVHNGKRGSFRIIRKKTHIEVMSCYATRSYNSNSQKNVWNVSGNILAFGCPRQTAGNSALHDMECYQTCPSRLMRSSQSTSVISMEKLQNMLGHNSCEG